jgi:hypothetical protein
MVDNWWQEMEATLEDLCLWAGDDGQSAPLPTGRDFAYSTSWTFLKAACRVDFTMHRIFLTLAVTDTSLLLASFVLGLGASGEPRAPGAVWHGTHVLIGILTTMVTLLVHSIVYTYFLGTHKWVKEVVRVYQLPDWVLAQSKKNKSKAFRFEFWGMTLIGVTAWLGAGADARGLNPLWHLAMSSITFAFQLGAFAVEYMTIVAQARLLLEVKSRADVLREELYGKEDFLEAEFQEEERTGV